MATPETSIPPTSSGRSSLRRLAVVWILGGSCVFLWGLWQWRQKVQSQAGPRTTIQEFMAALQAGDRSAALKLLHQDLAGAAERTHDPDLLGAWQPTPDLSYELQGIKLHGLQATAGIRLIQQGYHVDAEIQLQQVDQQWQIRDIALTEFDARWPQLMRRQAVDRELQEQRANEELAAELQQALQRSRLIATPAEADSDTSRRR